MPAKPKHFTVIDARLMDGNPFEVVDRAVAQVVGLLEITSQAVEDAELMARNAELERQCQRGEELDAVGWPVSPQGRRWATVANVLSQIAESTAVLRRAASFDPRNPPKA